MAVNDDNPTGEDIYYVYADKCVECVGHHDEPACASKKLVMT